MTTEADERLRLVYDESQRAVADQRDAMADLRTRAAHLLAAASVVVTFLLGLGLGDTTPGAGTWIATGAFTLLALICVAIMLPGYGWGVTFSVKVLLDGFVDAEPPASLNDMHRRLALYADAHWDEVQERAVRPRHLALNVAGALLLVCVTAAVLDLTGKERDVPKTTRAQGASSPHGGCAAPYLEVARPDEVRVHSRTACHRAVPARVVQHRGLHPRRQREDAPPGVTCARPAGAAAFAAPRAGTARGPPDGRRSVSSARNGPSAWDDHSS